jgi:hypothetical protein
MTTQSPAWVSSADDMAAVVAGEGSLQPKSIEPPSARRARPSDLKSTLRCGIPWQIAKPPPSSSDADTEGSFSPDGGLVLRRQLTDRAVRVGPAGTGERSAERT